MNAARSQNDRIAPDIPVSAFRSHGTRRQQDSAGVLLLVRLIASRGRCRALRLFPIGSLPRNRTLAIGLAATAKAALGGLRLARGGECANPGNNRRVRAGGRGAARASFRVPTSPATASKTAVPGVAAARTPAVEDAGIPEPKSPRAKPWYAWPRLSVTGIPIPTRPARNVSTTRAAISPSGRRRLQSHRDASRGGHSLGGAVRHADRSGSATALCSLTNVSVVRSLCSRTSRIDYPAHRGFGQRWAFIRVNAGVRSATYNDRVVYLTTKESLPQLEMRVGTD